MTPDVLAADDSPRDVLTPVAPPAESAAPRDAAALVCEHAGPVPEDLVRALARRGYAVGRTTSLQGTAEVLRERRLDGRALGLVVLLPLVRGGTVELEALDLLRCGGVPVPLLLVGDARDGDPEGGADLAAARALRASAWDLLPADAVPAEVELRVVRLEERVEELRELARWRHRAVHDERTDLLRPVAFEARCREHFAAAQRHRFPLALLLLDLDDFGAVNKTHDHTVGDELIARVGRAIRETLRAEDCAGRLGGDEFGVVLPYTGRLEAVRATARILERVRSHSTGSARDALACLELSGTEAPPPLPVGITASAGIETFDGTDLSSVEQLRAGAERALRRAKLEGGDRCCYARALDAGEWLAAID